ncbi:Signal transduction histidine kinase [Paenibacillus sp. 1_12]|uniref:HAMP domain-containing sensor histidine kinase n=1 Tax=Paenibacillus sp. 1_12 TaxID=1566278 RepID=UPI0008E7856E|nr:HAMP domain-containing sensor histidine kinase [Paenibacillus sp. 1_12]SFM06679.1 Signal transduction histidine kinase [Paenibacillus sp. 1_12]
MKLRTKITLLIAFSLLLVLLLFNVITYITVVNMTTTNEIRLLWEAAQPIMSQPGLYSPDRWNRVSWLRPFLSPQSMIRIIDTNSQIHADLHSQDELTQIPAVFSARGFAKKIKTANTLIVYIQTPIIDENNITLGALQIGRKLDTLDEYLRVLVTVLMFTTLGAAFFALMSGMYYTRVILRPIHRLAFIMEVNQQNGVFMQMAIPPYGHHDELGQLVQTFNTMIGKLEHNFNRQKQFLADASHELKTPLTIIESYADLLKRWGGSDTALREEAIEAIQSEAARLRNLTQSLLSLANTEAEGQKLWQTFDLTELVRTTAATLQQTFHRSVHVDNPSIISLYGDPGQIKQLLIILLDNAIKYSQKPIRIQLFKDQRDEDIIILRVIDQGIGVEPTEIPRLFDRFYRVDQARSRETGGSGLGLAIARNIVRLHKGTVTITSSIGAGTQVTVKLPLRYDAHVPHSNDTQTKNSPDSSSEES